MPIKEKIWFYPRNKWKILTKEEVSNLKSYQNYYSHYKKIIGEVEELKNLIKDKEEMIKTYSRKLILINLSDWPSSYWLPL